jgi:hypothetical protein
VPLVAAAAAVVARPAVAAVVTGPAKVATSVVEVEVEIEVAAAVAGAGRFTAAAVVLDGKATSAFPDKSIQQLHQYELTEALFPAPWHGT